MTHINPVVHGQAMMAQLFLEESEKWEKVEVFSLNTVYAEQRDNLNRFSLRKILRMWNYFWQAVSLIKRESVDKIVITPSFFKKALMKDLVLACLLRRIFDVEVVGWVHMDPQRIEWSNLPKWLRSVYRYLMKEINKWVACAPSLVKDWKIEELNPRFSVANGIDVPVQEREPSEKVRVLYLSAMEREKGWKDLYKIAQRICEKYKNIQFDFYGSGSDMSELHDFFGKSEQIIWHGYADAAMKQRAFSQADIFVLPSHTEQFPLTILEAMANSLPIVATHVGAVADALNEEYMYKVGDVQLLENLLVDFIKGSDLRNEVGKRNKIIYEERFTQSIFGERWQSLLLNIDN